MWVSICRSKARRCRTATLPLLKTSPMSDTKLRTSTRKLVIKIETHHTVLKTCDSYQFCVWFLCHSPVADQTTVCWSFCSTRTRPHSITLNWWTNWSAWTAPWAPCCTTWITCRAGLRKSLTWSRATWAGQVRHQTPSAVTTFVQLFLLQKNYVSYNEQRFNTIINMNCLFNPFVPKDYI